MPAPKPSATRTKSAQIADEILQNITNGTWPPGSKLPPERELIDVFGVSRVCIRKALASLTGQGILTAVQGGGTYVNEVLPGDYLANALQMVVMDNLNYLEVQKFRLMMEPMIASTAAVTAGAEDIESMRACIARQTAAEQRDDLTGYLEEDNLFHRLLADSVHNELMTKVFSLINDLMDLAMAHTAELTQYEDGVSFHRRIFEAIEAHDSEGARSLMWCHVYGNIAAYIRRYGDPGKTAKTEPDA